MISCQKYALSLGFSSPIMLDRFEPCRGRFSIFEKNVQFFPLKGKKLTPSHFVRKLAQIVGYGQTVIGIVQSGPRRWFSIPIIIPECVQMKKSKLIKKKFQKNFSLPISLRVTLKLSLRSRFSAKKYFFVFCRKFAFDLEKMSNHYSQLKKQVKVDSETRSYDFLTKTREKNPMSRNRTDPDVTL